MVSEFRLVQCGSWIFDCCLSELRRTTKYTITLAEEKSAQGKDWHISLTFIWTRVTVRSEYTGPDKNYYNQFLLFLLNMEHLTSMNEDGLIGILLVSLRGAVRISLQSFHFSLCGTEMTISPLLPFLLWLLEDGVTPTWLHYIFVRQRCSKKSYVKYKSHACLNWIAPACGPVFHWWLWWGLCSVRKLVGTQQWPWVTSSHLPWLRRALTWQNGELTLWLLKL